MSPTDLLLVLAMAAAVYLPKLLPLLLVSERRSARLRGWLRYLAPAVLGALVGPSIVLPGGRLATPGWEHLAYLLALLLAAFTHRLVLALGVGLGLLLLPLLRG